MKWDKPQNFFAGENSFIPAFSHVIGAICGFSDFPVHICLQNGEENDLMHVFYFHMFTSV